MIFAFLSLKPLVLTDDQKRGTSGPISDKGVSGLTNQRRHAFSGDCMVKCNKGGGRRAGGKGGNGRRKILCV